MLASDGALNNRATWYDKGTLIMVLTFARVQERSGVDGGEDNRRVDKT